MAEIKKNETNFEVSVDGKKAGLMEYNIEDDKLIITHTEVDPAFGGKGLGKELVRAGAELARENKLKIVPVCSYAKKVLTENADFQDVLA